LEVMNFLTKHWQVLTVFVGLVLTIWRLTIKEVKYSQNAQTQLLAAKLDSKFAELRGSVTSEISVIKTRLESLCRHVEKQNGRIGKAEAWQLEHTEHYHSRREN